MDIDGRGQSPPVAAQAGAAAPAEFRLPPVAHPPVSRVITPHFPVGVLRPEDLRKIADLCDQFPEARLKLSGDIVIGGIADADRFKAAKQLLGLPTYEVAGHAIRPVKACAGGYTCNNHQQDSFALAAKLDARFAGRPTPGKLLIAVAGCGRCCSEAKVRDIGIVAAKTGYAIYVGGAAGARPRIAGKIAENLTEPAVIECLDRIIAFYERNGKPPERLGAFIEKLGLEQFMIQSGLNTAGLSVLDQPAATQYEPCALGAAECNCTAR